LCPWGPRIFNGTDEPDLSGIFVDSGCNIKADPIDGTDGDLPSNLCKFATCLPSPQTLQEIHISLSSIGR
jgi:hypothetical protein